MTWCKSIREQVRRGARSKFGPCFLHNRAANGPALPVAVEQNITFIGNLNKKVTMKNSTPNFTFVFDELTLVIALPQRLEDGFIGESVVFTQKCFQVTSSFGAMIYPEG
jgi:hypothetical protein